MAYSNAIFYINLTSGSDAARTALTTCIASNPSGTTVRINKTSHGLVTGAIVDLTLFDTYLNDAWKITVVDANNFDLDGAAWSVATVDNNGTVTPRGGSSWTDGWLSITSGATAARTQSGDTIRISKTGDPVSLGNATWTNLSKTVTLASAQTTTIDLCETAWTAANSSAVGTSPFRKQGSVSCYVYPTTSPATNTRYAYRTLASALNLSAYDAITFFLSCVYYSFNTGNWKICLCSDTIGAVVVDTFEIPGINFASYGSISAGWRPIVLTRTGGGALGSSIQSIAIYSSTVAPGTGNAGNPGHPVLDSILACVSTGLTLRSLISKNSSASGGSEAWYPIQSINGTTVTLDAYAQVDSTAGRGYYGTSETVTTYYRNTFNQSITTNATSIAMNIINEGGSAAYPITYTGGWNTSTTVQDGETFYDGSNSYGYGLYMAVISNVVVERLSFVRYYDGVYFLNSVSRNNVLRIPNLIACGDYGFYDLAGRNSVTIGNIVACNNGLKPAVGTTYAVTRIEGNLTNGVATTTTDNAFTLTGSLISNNGTYGISTSTNFRNLVEGCTLTSNGTAGIYNDGELFLFNTTINGTEFAGPTNAEARVFSTNHDLSGYAYIHTDGGTIDQRASTFSGASGAEWRLNVNSSTRTSAYPLKLPVAQYAVASGSLLLVSASMKKSHATDVRGRLVIPGGQLLGVPNDVVATLADNTNEQGLTVSCTPTMSGVLGVEVWAEYVNNTGNVSVDTVTARV